MKNKLNCSIVIRTYNHFSDLERLLKKIKEQKKVVKPEIVIIDSSSKDGTVELAKREGGKVININPKDFSHAYTFNLGAKNGKNEIIVYASVDIIPKDEFWLYNLLKHFEKKDVGGVFGKQEPIPGFNFIEEYKTKKMFLDDGTTIANFSNANGAIRKNLWKKIKYNEKVPYQHIGGEDQELVNEIKKRGYKIIYEPLASVYHSHKYPLKTRLNSAYEIGSNQKKIEEWNKNVAILKYNKLDLILFLIKKRAFKTFLIDFLLAGILMRFYALKGKLDRIRLNK